MSFVKSTFPSQICFFINSNAVEYFFKKQDWTMYLHHMTHEVFHQIWLVVCKHACKLFQDVFERAENIQLLFGCPGKNDFPRHSAIFRRAYVQIWELSLPWKFSKIGDLALTHILHLHLKIMFIVVIFILL